jgi:hypothetical protein
MAGKNCCRRHGHCYIANDLRYLKSHFVLIGKPALAALLAGIVLLLDAMAACPALHEMIHKDANEPDHQCAVVTLAHGKIESASCEIIVPPPTILVEVTKPFTISVFTPAIENLPQGRAPPMAASPQV